MVYGARNMLLGADGSWIAMLPAASVAEPDSGSQAATACAEQPAPSCSSNTGGGGMTAGDTVAEATQPSRPHPFHPNLQVRRGVLAAECGDTMRRFFARRRQQAAAAKAAGC